MKRGILIFSMAGALIGAFALGRAFAQEGPGEKAAEDEMAAWMELGKPGTEHAELMKSVGTWTVASKAWMQPGAEPTLTTGKAVFTALLGGRYLRQEFEGDFMGQPFHGIGCTAFNNATRKYEDVWIDGMSTGIMFTTGTETEPGKAWSFSGSCAGPGGKEMKMRSVLRKLSDDEMSVESYCDQGSGETKCWEATYTRTK
ncbi:MAG: DUF1579 domain-containing protein [Planctomycetota bacterium]